MARIVFHSAGYWGDVMPYVPVANELAARGHDVTYAVPVGHHALLDNERFTLADSGNPLSPELVADDEAHDRLVSRDGMRFGGALTGRYFMNEWVLPYLRDNVDALLKLGEDADLFVTHPTAGSTTRIAADALGIPMTTGHLFPMILEVTHKLPRALRPLLGLLVGDRPINGLRREHGLAPIAFNATTATVHDEMLLLWSDHFMPRQPQWPSTWRTTGFTLWNGPAGTALAPEIGRYVADGEPPIVVTLGSSSALVGAKMFEAIATRLDDLGQRALFLTGTLQQLTPRLRARTDVFAFAPLSAVLPHARAVVHSGGFGTVAAALTAGTPSVTVPYLIDQKWNAQRLETLGLGLMVKQRRRVERLWDALDTLLGDGAYSVRARDLANRMAGEDGTRVAADAIEERLTTVR